MIDALYFPGVAITILVINILSFLALTFVIVIYILKWKQIASYPMRLVLQPSHSLSISVFRV